MMEVVKDQGKDTSQATAQLLRLNAEDATPQEELHSSSESDVCAECGGRGIIEHPCWPGYYGDCPLCGTDIS
jgi:hypothetical protein